LPGLWVLLIIGKLIVDFAWYTPFPIEVENQYGTKGPFADWDKTNLVIGIGYLSFAYYTWLTLAAYRKYHTFIQQNYSFSDDVDPRWLKKLLIWIAVGVGLFFLLNIYSIFIGNTTYKANWYAYFGLGLINYYLSIAGYFRKNSLQEKVIFQAEQIAEESQDTPHEMTKTEAELAIQAALFELMRSQRPYLRSDLTLTELAKLLQTNAPAISKVINQTGSNFNDFINEYRVREVQHKIEKHEHKAQTLLAIAFDSGFNSKATFNRAFKKIVGQTPKAYIEALS
jgi:AraC-like DNA-binding protein